ncbi:MAG: diacylglycerol kinase family protein [Ferruginibacter sp.]
MNHNIGLKVLFVINPGAGSNNNSWENIISDYFTGKPFIPDYYLLEKKPVVEKLRQYISDTKPAYVIAVGGDGTVGMLAKIIAGSSIALGILPAGSANGMAKELDISEVPEDALAVIETGEVRCCDAIRINEKDLCLHLSDIGLNAQLIKYFDEGKLRGIWGYAKVVLKTLWRKQKMLVRITTKTEEIERIAFMVVVANASKYGTGAVINPDGKLDDGLFEVVIVRKLAISELLKMLFRFTPFNPQKIETFHATTLRIETHKRMHFQIDGEYKGKINKINATILPNHINLVLPAAKPEDTGS